MRINKNFQPGFTLIELLIVIAVIGVLAIVVILFIDPLEQIARARDTGRKSSLKQLSNALRAYYTSKNTMYPPHNSGGGSPVLWQTHLEQSGDITKKIIVDPVADPGVCSVVYNDGNICYKRLGAEVVIWTTVESKSEKTKANCPPSEPIAAFGWSSSQNKVGHLCIDSVDAINVTDDTPIQ